MRSSTPHFSLIGLLSILLHLAACSHNLQEYASPEAPIQFTGPTKGCASFMVYQINEAGDRSLAISGDRQALELSTQLQSFPIATTDNLQITLLAYEGDIDRYYCDDALGDEPQLLDRWDATSGQALIRIVEDNTGQAGPGQTLYTLSIELRDVRLRNAQGEVINIDHHVFDIVEVGWLPG